MMCRGEAKLSKQTLTLLSITSNRDGAGDGAEVEAVNGAEAGAGAGRVASYLCARFD